MAQGADPRELSRRPHLGSGWSFPVRPIGGRLTWSAYEEDVEQAIGIVIQTQPKERVMLTGFGAGLRDYVFEVNSPSTRARLEDAVRAALLRFEPRITVERVEALEGDAPNVLLVEIDYVVRRTNSFYNRVYPFYLTEAG